MRITQLLPLALLAAQLTAAPNASAQARDTAAGPTLTLEEALRLASRYNADYQIVRNNRRAAGAALRSAYGDLLPSADAQFSSRFSQGGRQPFQGLQFDVPDTRQSSYWLGLTYRLSPATLLGPAAQRANVAAAEADVAFSNETVRSAVAQQYLTALQAAERAMLQDTLVVSAEAQLELARARAAVGAGTQLDVTRAEVTLGQSRVTALQAHNTAEIEKLRLFQQMGVPQPANVRLTSTFTVSEPSFTLESVLQMAQRQNPALGALRARDRSASVNVRQTQSAYLPTLSISTGWGGYTYEYTSSQFLVDQAILGARGQFSSCMTRDSLRAGAGLAPLGGCGTPDLTPDEISAIQTSNEQFPFNFTKQPWSLTAFVTLPLFDGFQREQRIQEAQVARDNARSRVKARELQLTQEVTAAYLSLVTAARTVALQQQNAARAREELRLVEERFRVGAGNYLDITQARASFQQAETERINAIYDYHRAFSTLEAAVGRPLR